MVTLARIPTPRPLEVVRGSPDPAIPPTEGLPPCCCLLPSAFCLLPTPPLAPLCPHKPRNTHPYRGLFCRLPSAFCLLSSTT